MNVCRGGWSDLDGFKSYPHGHWTIIKTGSRWVHQVVFSECQKAKEVGWGMEWKS